MRWHCQPAPTTGLNDTRASASDCRRGAVCTLWLHKAALSRSPQSYGLKVRAINSRSATRERARVRERRVGGGEVDSLLRNVYAHTSLFSSNVFNTSNCLRAGDHCTRLRDFRHVAVIYLYGWTIWCRVLYMSLVVKFGSLWTAVLYVYKFSIAIIAKKN